MDKKHLGMGLSELLNENLIYDMDSEGIIDIDVNDLIPNPYQPRTTFNNEAIAELAASIKEYGVVQPIIVKRKGTKFIIVAGERRFRATKEAKLKKIPAIIRNYDDNIMAEVSLLENLQRENLNILEEALAYVKLINKFKITQEEFARKIGKSRSYVSNTIGLLKLPKKVQKLITEEGISMSHARVLSKIDDKDQVEELTKLVVSNNISVREIEEISKSIKKKKSGKISLDKKKFREIEKAISNKLNLRSKVTNNKITINYNDEGSLDAILDILKKIGD